MLDHGYLTAGWLDYGYASTVHTAQGVLLTLAVLFGAGTGLAALAMAFGWVSMTGDDWW